MTYPIFVQQGKTTPEGEALLEWLEAQYKPAEEGGNIDYLNSLVGPVAEYIAITRTRGKTPVGWLESFPQSAANAYDYMKTIERIAKEDADAAQKLDMAANKQKAMQEQFDALRAQLETMNQALIEAMAIRDAKIEALEGRLAQDQDEDQDEKPDSKTKGRAKAKKREIDDTTLEEE
jgi:hypothetical protein